MRPLDLLYVDDDPDMHELADIALSLDPQISVTFAASGEEALSILERFHPDGVLLDVVMPGLDGPAVLERMRQIPGHEETPVVFVTGHTHAVTLQELRAMGGKGAVTKPFDPKFLAKNVRMFLGAG
ncbi:response regulator [Caulobacter sp. NIBR2454]|uniref:response regulator n=1 Tax=Caulobacter sp. NIBR2454 TaxID=3015996 RepID=UPI0022B7250F|nr:response regulator [Caulobacter sp. NIBR2454]